MSDSTSDPRKDQPTRQIVCPLCAMACDDVTYSRDGSLVLEGCKTVGRFQMDDDRGAFDRILDQFRQRPIQVVTTGTDLLTARRLIDWQAAGRIELSIESDRSIESMLRSVSRDGTVSATLADVAMHRDYVWMIGDVEKTWPRMAHVLRLDDLPGAAIERTRELSAESLAELAAVRLSDRTDPDQGDSFTRSRYAAILIGPNAFCRGEEDLAATMIGRIVRHRNQKYRAVCVAMDTAATLRSVGLWKHNDACPAADRPRYDIRIGSPMNDSSPPAICQIGGQDSGEAKAEVFVAAAFAGIHFRSMIIRGDGAVSLPLSAIPREGTSHRVSPPSPIDWLARILS